MAISGDGYNHGGVGSKTDASSSDIGGYIRVSPIDVTEFTIVTNLGTLTQADFTLTGTYYEYYNINLRSVDSASVTGYVASISRTTSHGDLVFEVVFHPTRLYAWTDSSSSSNAKTLYAWYNDFDGPGAPSDADRVIYTTTPNPTINSTLYDSNKNVITLGDGISSASNSAITIQYLPSDY